MTFLPDATLEHLRGVVDRPDLSETKYRLVREIGRGGMGAVYLAEDTTLGREVAVKVLDALDPDAARRMTQEARILATLEHPGVVPIHDAGTLPDGRILGLILAFLVAAMPSETGKHYYFEIMLPGAIVGAIVGFATQKFRSRREPHPART